MVALAEAVRRGTRDTKWRSSSRRQGRVAPEVCGRELGRHAGSGTGRLRGERDQRNEWQQETQLVRQFFPFRGTPARDT